MVETKAYLVDGLKTLFLDLVTMGWVLRVEGRVGGMGQGAGCGVESKIGLEGEVGWDCVVSALGGNIIDWPARVVS